MIQASTSLLQNSSGSAPSPEVAKSGRSLTHSFSWTLLGMLTYGACQWGMLVVLARMGDAETSQIVVGQFALALAVTAPVMLLAGMSLRTVQATDHGQDYKFGDYLGLQMTSGGMALAAVMVIAMCSGKPVEAQVAIMLMGLAKSIELLSELFYGLQQRHERMDNVGKSLVIKGIISLAAVAAGVHLTGSAVGATAALALSWGAMLIFWDVRMALQSNYTITPSQLAAMAPRWDKEQLWALTRVAMPLGVSIMLGALIVNVPRYFLDYYWKDKILAIFAALAYFTIAGNLVASALAQSALPRLSRYYAAGESGQFRKLLVGLLGLGVVLGLAGIMLTIGLGRQILAIYGPAYAEHSDVFLVLMISLAFVFPTFFLDFSLFAARQFSVLTPINAIMVIVTTIASWLIIPKFGLMGAAWVTCLVAALQMAVRCVVVWRMVAKSPVRATSKQIGDMPSWYERDSV